MNSTKSLLALVSLALLAGCVTVPPGPSVQVLPGSRKSFDQFQFDDARCRQLALNRSGAPSDAANSAGAASAVAGTVIGAAIGALIGGGEGAAVGAGLGLFTGAAAGTGASQGAFVGTQRSYDNAYLQCMYASGNKVPVPGGFVTLNQPRPTVQPTAMNGPPPNAAIPPPGTPAPNLLYPSRSSPPPNAAIPPPNTPAPYQLPPR